MVNPVSPSKIISGIPPILLPKTVFPVKDASKTVVGHASKPEAIT